MRTWAGWFLAAIVLLGATVPAGATSFVPMGEPVPDNSWIQTFVYDAGADGSSKAVGRIRVAKDIGWFGSDWWEPTAMDNFSAPPNNWQQTSQGDEWWFLTHVDVTEAKGDPFSSGQLTFDLHLPGNVSDTFSIYLITEYYKSSFFGGSWKQVCKETWCWDGLTWSGGECFDPAIFPEAEEEEVPPVVGSIPEPLTVLAVFGGIAGLGGYVRRRRVG